MPKRGDAKKLNCTTKGRTHKAFKKDADINNIMQKYKRTGLLGNPNNPDAQSPKFGDFSSIPDYAEVLNKCIEIENDFMRLPSDVRKKFNNDVQNVIDFVSDQNNVKEAVDLGLLPETALPPHVTPPKEQSGEGATPESSTAAPSGAESGA